MVPPCRISRTGSFRYLWNDEHVTVEATTERVLRLLGLLQRRSSWTAAELAAELCVSLRSVGRVVQGLRALG
ncbi:HTH domain-containing protein, partial [Micromonospora sp. NPDC049799]|uniref:HTH domain-containing protein n=1 Tax=Micromonospora sp. NPDC049799 TaxID=3154741 RepID=UPI0033F4DD1B